MSNLETFLDKFLTILPKDPPFILAMSSMLLAGFALYVVLTVVKTLAKQGKK